MDFPDSLTPRSSKPAPKPTAPSVASAGRHVVNLDPNDLPLRKPADIERIVLQLQRNHEAELAVLKRAEQNQTHLLSVIAGWMVCVGALAMLMFASLVMAVTVQLWRVSQSEVWNDMRGPIGFVLAAWATIILVMLLVPIGLRRCGFRMFKLER